MFMGIRESGEHRTHGDAVVDNVNLHQCLVEGSSLGAHVPVPVSNVASRHSTALHQLHTGTVITPSSSDSHSLSQGLAGFFTKTIGKK